uniref:Uncharacterized protein n=1 Tax=viral metagenome TaxID=1070528 RepID=A0A6M3K8C8_9ZZZZ
MMDFCRFKVGTDITSGKYTKITKLCKPYSDWTVDFKVSGSASQARITIEGNTEGEDFATIGMATHTATSGTLNWSGQWGFGTFSINDQPASVIRAKCVYLSGFAGGNIDWIKIMGV